MNDTYSFAIFGKPNDPLNPHPYREPPQVVSLEDKTFLEGWSWKLSDWHRVYTPWIDWKEKRSTKRRYLISWHRGEDVMRLMKELNIKGPPGGFGKHRKKVRRKLQNKCRFVCKP